MNSMIKGISLALSLAFIAACSEVNMSCAPAEGVVPLCGVQMPEDLAAMPDGGGILIGEYGNGGLLTGDLVWYQPGEDAEFVHLITSKTIMRGANQENWGQANCPQPDKLSPHGIHLSTRGDRLQLLVVNHSSAEHVLFYEVQPAATHSAAPSLAWRGCVAFPEHAVLNDVVALPDGGFAVTHMYNPATMAELQSMLGMNNGHVWRWTPGSEIRVIANSSAKMPNGIEASPDGKSLWINNYIEGELRQIDVATEEILARVNVANIDNSAWLDDGRLLLAAHTSPLSLAPCFGLLQGSCGSPYELVAVDTDTGSTEVIFSTTKGGPFGPATVAIPYLGKLYAGSFSGDRMAELQLR